jgi:hypothetical protein
MNLLERLNISKRNLVKGAGTDTRANLTVETYLDMYGFRSYVFSEKVREFFIESRRHYHRVAYRNAMAQCLGLDMTKPSDRDQLWWQVASAQGLDRKMRIHWHTGRVDPQLEHVETYLPQFYDGHPHCKEPAPGDILSPVRMGIARAVTYIRVFPPENPISSLPDADMIPKELQDCWDTLRRHVHYRRHRNLNQHALDTVRDVFRDRLWMEDDEIGRWKVTMEGDRSTPALPFWFWPWAIFRYATLGNIQSSNKTTSKNPHRWIWNIRQNGQSDLWRLEP